MTTLTGIQIVVTVTAVCWSVLLIALAEEWV